MNDTPTKETMSIYLLNIPFVIVGIAIAIVPLLIKMRHQVRTDVSDVDRFSATNAQKVTEYDHAT